MVGLVLRKAEMGVLRCGMGHEWVTNGSFALCGVNFWAFAHCFSAGFVKFVVAVMLGRIDIG